MEADKVTYDGDDFVVHTINGQDVEIETFQASDELAAIERKYRTCSNQCLACGETQPAVADSNICGSCGEKNTVTFSQVFLDAVIGLLKNRYGVKASNRTAAMFYANIRSREESLKKKSDHGLGSPTGTELTPADGPTGE